MLMISTPRILTREKKSEVERDSTSAMNLDLDDEDVEDRGLPKTCGCRGRMALLPRLRECLMGSSSCRGMCTTLLDHPIRNRRTLHMCQIQRRDAHILAHAERPPGDAPGAKVHVESDLASALKLYGVKPRGVSSAY